jgi:flagellar hook assembly protein FlgD
MSIGGTRQQVSQNQPINSIYLFKTDLVTIQLKDSTGALIDTGTASYYAGGWHDLGPPHSGQVAVELLPGTYAFAMVYNGQRQQISQAIIANSNVVFQTKLVTLNLEDHNGNLMDSGTGSYYAGGWHDLGNTNSGQITEEMLPGTYAFAMVYNGERNQLSQDINANQSVVFQTVLATIQLQDHAGNALNTGNVSYYAGGWHTIGDTSGGQIQTEMLPGSYSFAMTYLGSRQQLDGQNVANPIVFQTGQVLSGSGTAKQYYAGGWKNFTQGMELLPGTYAFSFTGHAQTSYTVTKGTTTTIY